MYNGNPGLYSVYECGYTTPVGKVIKVKEFYDNMLGKHVPTPHYAYEGGTVYLEGGGHFNCYPVGHKNSPITHFAVGDVLEVIDIVHEKSSYSFAPANAILRKISSVDPKSAELTSLTDILLCQEL